MPESDAALDVLSSPVRRRILRVLEPEGRSGRQDRGRQADTQGLTAGQLATGLSLHVTTVRFHLDQLVAAGLVEADFQKQVGAGRPRKVYRSVRAGPTPVSSEESLHLLSALLTEAFSAQAVHERQLSPEEAGRQWAQEHVTARDSEPATTTGEWVAKLGRALDVLRSWGYEPELTVGGAARDARVDLTHCPFRDLAQQNTAVVCGIHQGLIAGTMSRLGEPDTTVDLHAFAEGDRCIAYVHSPAPAMPGTDQPGTTKETR